MFRGWLTPLLLVALSSVAIADPTPAQKQHAAELATESAQHYKRGEFEVSVALLREAYALYPQPNLLYNLGRSLEGVGDLKGAIEAYESYLATGNNIDDRGAIERRVATLKATLPTEKPRVEAEKPPGEAEKPINPAPQPLPVVISAPPPHDEASPSKLPWITMIAGVAVVGGGAAFGELASSRHDQAGQPATSGLAADGLQTDARRYATIANVMFAVGGVVIAGGIVWEIHDHHGRSSGVAARARIGPGSFAVEWTFP